MKKRALKIKVPKKLLWDYKKAPEDLLWRLQRLADFFPRYGRDKKTVEELFRNLGKLKVDFGTRNLIKYYHEKHKR